MNQRINKPVMPIFEALPDMYEPVNNLGLGKNLDKVLNVI